MANSKQMKITCKPSANNDPGEEIVISGVAGRFPKSNNMREFADNLYNKGKLTTTEHTRYDARNLNVPPALGVINNINKFDSLFFGVSYKQATVMDPMSKMLLEHAFEALFDAGINPQSLRGTNTGVYIGCCFSDMETYAKEDDDSGLGLVGCCRSIFANRISFFLDVRGPSLCVDTACSSSLSAFDIAYRAIRDGECDNAIVGGCNMCSEVAITRMFHQLGVLTTGDACHCFDFRDSGYVRSEAIGALVLQKAKDAKRIYATVVHTKSSNDGYKEFGLTYPSHERQLSLYKEIYEEAGVSPHEVSFIEAHATSTKVGDPEEVMGIDQFYSPGRTKPLLMGSVKSNVGHAEGASAICSLAKVLIAMENGLIPPNINYEKPRENMEGLVEGRLKVVTEATPLEEGYVAVSSYGFGGSNVHVILKPHSKKKPGRHPAENDLPKLIFVSGRTQEAVDYFLNDVENRPVDVEYIRLLHEVFSSDIVGHFYRGHTIINSTINENSVKGIEKYEGEARPVWFVCSGMGSQWPGMGTSLMRFPIFAKAIQRCDSVLKPRGVDIMDIITNTDKHNFDNILRSFVGITAIQIGLIDLLKAVGIVPDKVIGHSLGELACAYVDGCFTIEEAILSAYSRGLASIESELICGSMAAVGLGYKQIKDLCPSDIEVACHNGPSSCTISGPKTSMNAFISQLQTKGVFVKEVPTSNVAYHSRYIAPAGTKLLNYLRKIIKDPKARSEKWLSTSVPQSEWSSPKWKLSSAEYHTNNLLSPVLFEEIAALIPENAITIEISPHGLLQSILKQSLDRSVLNVALTKRDHKDNTEMFLQALGKLYNAGLQPQLAELYPKIQFPVSRGTPMISPLVKWDHSEDWAMTDATEEMCGVIVKTFNISFSNHLGKSMSGHIIDGRNLVPATAYLALVWDVYKAQKGGQNVSIVFEDVMFNRATIIPEKGNLQLIVTVEEGSEKFNIIESNEAIVTGTVRILQNPQQEWIPAEYLSQEDTPEEMETKDVYKELRLRGYHYSGMFRGIQRTTITGSKGHLAWKNNWISFLDTILQLQILHFNYRDLVIPTRIKKLVIDVAKHEEALQGMSTTDASLPFNYYEQLQTAVCGGVVIRNVSVLAIPRRVPTGIPVLEEYKFVAHRDSKEINLYEAISLSMNLAIENIPSMNVQSVEFIDKGDDVKLEELVSPLIIKVLGNIPMIRSTPLIISNSGKITKESLPANIEIIDSENIPEDTSALIAFGHDLLSNDRVENLKILTRIVEDGGFLVSFENGNYYDEQARNFGLNVIMEKRVDQKKIVLLKKKVQPPKTTVAIRVNNNEFSWLEEVKKVLHYQAEDDSALNIKLILLGEGFENGLLGFVNCLRREPGGNIVTGVLIQDKNAPKFSLNDPFYREQLELDLAINVFQENAWGTYRHLPLPPIEPKLVPFAKIEQKVRGDLKSFTWIESHFDKSLLEDNYVYIYYSALNFRDVMLATGKLQDDTLNKAPEVGISPIGYEYSGIDKAGNRIMGMLFGRSFANVCKYDNSFMFPVPDKWTLEEAATIPCAYGTCYYAFYVVGQIKKGHKVLIHSGSGAVGQAAINLALHEGCEVFTTVGTPEKRKFIRETFPMIDDDHIGNSRDTSFELMVLKQTKGQGVDIVLNSLSAEKLQASLRCLATYGQFLEIGRFDIMVNNKLGMSDFSTGITFRPVMLNTLLLTESEESRMLSKLMYDGIQKGVVKPLNTTVFEKDEVETAFRYMAAGKHIGKVMIRIRKEGEPLDTPVLALPQYYCRQNGVYLIFGGLGGFGLELANWLVLRGARNFVLVSRTGVKNGYQHMRIKSWETQSVKVLVVAGKDVSSAKDVEAILKKAEELGTIDGIFNLVASLRDAVFTNQTQAAFEESFKGKAWLTKILDQLTRKMCPRLRHFVTDGTVKVHYLEGDHLTILENVKIAEIINDLTTDSATI